MLGALAAVPLTAQHVDSQRLAGLKTIPAELLARAYLVNEYTLGLLAMVRQGATLQSIDDSMRVDASNADSATREHETRRATYAAAIRARGFANVSGEYEVSAQECPQGSGAVLATLDQDEFRLSLYDGAMQGVIVERTIVFGEGPESGGFYTFGTFDGDRARLQPFEGDGCRSLLARYRPPDVRLKDPELWLGTWEGRWDDIWDVRFTITAQDSGFMVTYEHREHKGGPFQAESGRFHPVSPNAIRGGPIVITLTGKRKAEATGAFGQRRVAQLRRTTE